MYRLPKNINLAFFLTREIEQICFGANSLILNFDGYLSVNVTSSIGLADSTGRMQEYLDFREGAQTLLALINQPVTSATSDEAGTLLLTFASGTVLAIYDDSDQFESYFIQNGDQLIVV